MESYDRSSTRSKFSCRGSGRILPATKGLIDGHKTMRKLWLKIREIIETKTLRVDIIIIIQYYRTDTRKLQEFWRSDYDRRERDKLIWNS